MIEYVNDTEELPEGVLLSESKDDREILGLFVKEELPDSELLGQEVREELWEGDEVTVTEVDILTVV